MFASKRFGQVSVEFLLVTGAALLILTASMYFVFGFMQSSADSTALYQSANLGYVLVDEARSVFLLGSGSFVSVSASNPDLLQSVYVTPDNALVFNVSTANGVVSIPVFSSIPLAGIRSGDSDVSFIHSNDRISSGRTSYRLTNRNGVVEIRQVS